MPGGGFGTGLLPYQAIWRRPLNHRRDDFTDASLQLSIVRDRAAHGRVCIHPVPDAVRDRAGYQSLDSVVRREWRGIVR